MGNTDSTLKGCTEHLTRTLDQTRLLNLEKLPEREETAGAHPGTTDPGTTDPGATDAAATDTGGSHVGEFVLSGGH